MSKVILVIDKPEHCEQCPVKYITQCYGVARKRNPKCPLKPLPQRKSINQPLDAIESYKAFGYNACLDEILGGE